MSAGSPALAVGERRWVNASFGVLAWIVGLVFFFPDPCPPPLAAPNPDPVR